MSGPGASCIADEQQHSHRRSKTLQRKHKTLVHTAQQAHRFWLGAQRFQSLLENCWQAVSLQSAIEMYLPSDPIGTQGE